MEEKPEEAEKTQIKAEEKDEKQKPKKEESH